MAAWVWSLLFTIMRGRDSSLAPHHTQHVRDWLVRPCKACPELTQEETKAQSHQKTCKRPQAGQWQSQQHPVRCPSPGLLCPLHLSKAQSSAHLVTHWHHPMLVLGV